MEEREWNRNSRELDKNSREWDRNSRRRGRGGFARTFLITLLAVLIPGGILLAVLLLVNTVPETPVFDGAVEVMTEAIPEEAEMEEAGEERYGDILSDPEYMRANRIYAKDTAVEGEVTLAFAGDILFDDNYSIMAAIKQRPGGIEDSFSPDLLEEMREADLFMVNNEFPYSSGGKPTEEKQFTFRARPESVSMLLQMGVDLVSLANNHAYDYGEEALLDTFATLEEAGIPFVGAGRELEEAVHPVYFIAGGLKIAFVSATQIERLDNPDTKEATAISPGVFRCWNPDRLLEVVKEAGEKSDFVVVYIHWGTENVEEPDWAQLDQAPKLAEAGADLIIGDHPHCLQGFAYHGGVPVIYSVGNFLFNSKTLDTCLIKVRIGEEGMRSLQFLPAVQENRKTSLLSGAEKDRVLNYMRELSPGAAIDQEGFVSETH